MRGATTIYWLSFAYWLLSCSHVFLVKERKEILLFVLTVAVLLAFALWPKDSESVLVIREGQVRPDSVVPEASIAKRYRHVQLEPAAIQSVREGEQVIELELFPGETIRVRLQESEQTGQQSTEVYGSIEGVPGSMVTLVTYENVLAGTVQYPDGRTFMVNYAGDAEHSIVELDSDAMQTPPERVAILLRCDHPKGRHILPHVERDARAVWGLQIAIVWRRPMECLARRSRSLCRSRSRPRLSPAAAHRGAQGDAQGAGDR